LSYSFTSKKKVYNNRFPNCDLFDSHPRIEVTEVINLASKVKIVPASKIYSKGRKLTNWVCI